MAVAGGFSSCTTETTHSYRSDHYVHDVPREREYYSTDHNYYNSAPSYGYGRTYRDTEEPGEFNVVNQYDRMSR